MSDLMDRVERALRLEGMRLPTVPRVVELKGAPYVDHLGDEELHVWIVIDDDTTDEELLGGGIREIRNEIDRRLREEGVTRFPYTTIVTQSEFAETTAGGSRV